LETADCEGIHFFSFDLFKLGFFELLLLLLFFVFFVFFCFLFVCCRSNFPLVSFLFGFSVEFLSFPCFLRSWQLMNTKIINQQHTNNTPTAHQQHTNNPTQLNSTHLPHILCPKILRLLGLLSSCLQRRRQQARITL